MDEEKRGAADGKKRLLTVGVVCALGLVALLGPRPDFEDRWIEPSLEADLDAYLSGSEAGVSDLRPGDGKVIEWIDPSSPSVSPLSLVYLHGFSADRHEVDPLVGDLARELGANVFFTRLRGHGRDGAAMGEVSVEDWLDDVAEAVRIGSYIGERVVLVGTSTGGTLALWAAARDEAADPTPLRGARITEPRRAGPRLLRSCCGPGEGQRPG